VNVVLIQAPASQIGASLGTERKSANASAQRTLYNMMLGTSAALAFVCDFKVYLNKVYLRAACMGVEVGHCKRRLTCYDSRLIEMLQAIMDRVPNTAYVFLGLDLQMSAVRSSDIFYNSFHIQTKRLCVAFANGGTKPVLVHLLHSHTRKTIICY